MIPGRAIAANAGTPVKRLREAGTPGAPVGVAAQGHRIVYARCRFQTEAGQTQMSTSYESSGGVWAPPQRRSQPPRCDVVRPGEMPGVRWVLAAIYLWFVVMSRALLYNWGVPVPFRLVSQIGNTAVLGLLAVGVFRYTQRHPLHQVFAPLHCQRIYYWFLLLAVFTGYGIARGNEWVTIGKEFTAFCYIGFFLILGGDDRFWAHISKPITILFYIGALLIVTSANTPIVQVLGNEVVQDLAASAVVAHRHILSIGYTLRPLMASALLLGVWGLVTKQKGLWGYLQISAPLVLFACEVGLFLFRSTAIYILIAGASYLILRPVFERRARIGKSVLVLFAAAVCIATFGATETSDFFLARGSEETQGEGLFESRNAEVATYVGEVGWGALVGRGVGGYFDASAVYQQPWEAEYAREAFGKWGTLHYGVLVFGLKGGFVMLTLFASMVAPGFRRRSRRWYRNPCNLAGALLFPTSVLMVVTNPLFLSVEGLLFMLALMIPLSRFARRRAPDIDYIPALAAGSRKRPA